VATEELGTEDVEGIGDAEGIEGIVDNVGSEPNSQT
jgi:hypothetical protein